MISSTVQRSKEIAASNKALISYINDLSRDDTRKLFDKAKSDLNFKAKKLTTEKIESIHNQFYEIVLQDFHLKGVSKGLENGIISTFRGGSKDPFHTWFPYLEGYSPDFVKGIIYKYSPMAKTCFDPFGGSGTTPITASKMGIKSYYSEVSPLMRYMIDLKTNVLSLSSKNKIKLIQKLSFIIESLDSIKDYPEDDDFKTRYASVFGDKEYFFKKDYSLLLKAKTFSNAINDSLVKHLFEGAVAGICLEISLLKRQGDIRYKNKKELENFKPCFFKSLKTKLLTIVDDISIISNQVERSTLLTQNARTTKNLPKEQIDLVITSPPYINGTNYIRNTKLELWYLGFLSSSEELREFRTKVITAGINDVQKNKKNNEVHFSLKDIWKELSEKSYDKRIPQMVNDYFFEMEDVIEGISHVLVKGGIAAIDIGDSIYAGVKIPVFDSYKLIAAKYDLKLVEDLTLRTRRSKDKTELRQALLVFKKNKTSRKKISLDKKIDLNWKKFKKELPHQVGEFSKRNWGHSRHSLCSYQGKLKPSIAKHLVETFVPDGGAVLDPFSGVGTIPFEASLTGRKGYGFDISPVGYNVSMGKVSKIDVEKVQEEIELLKIYLSTNKLSKADFNNASKISFNKDLVDYYQQDTFKEILLARKYFISNSTLDNRERAFVLSCLLHVLHGNRPYALSRRSHPITPFAPTGDFEYKSVVEKIQNKVNLALKEELPEPFIESDIYFQDINRDWPVEVDNLDAIITSPPFFDSTRFYLANWIRLWFCGWEEQDFKSKPSEFIDELQKKNMNIYQNMFSQAKERLKENGVLVLHLGKSKKCNMGEVLLDMSKSWFEYQDLFDESVVHCEGHGIKDKGTVSSHQYLVLK